VETLNSSDGVGGSGLVVVLAAPSGSGKTTVIRNVMELDGRLMRAVTCTTRLPREGEVEGVDYYFLSREEFGRRVEAGEFLEHAEVHGNRYGTLKSEVLERLAGGRDVLLNIDVQGAASVRRVAGGDPVLRRALVTVFLTTSTKAELGVRLRGRGTEGESDLVRRLGAAREEVSRWGEFDYLLLSGTEREDAERLHWILRVERMKTVRCTGPWQD
jgi:guanylate kinase